TAETAPTNSGNAWVWLGAVAQATSRVQLGTGVTGIVYRYNPVVVAQQVATLELLAPGRAFLGVGSSEAMNEVPAGMEWPSTEEQLARTEEALTIITRLLAGETVDFHGRFFRTKRAVLYSRPPRRTPVYMSAFHEGAAEVAARLADGVWTLGDPLQAPKVIGAYRTAREAAGREPGEIVVQNVFSFADSDDAALEQAREWKGTMVDKHYTDPIADPAAIYRRGEDEVSDAKFTKQIIASSDPDHHVKRIKAIEKLGATMMVLMNVSGNDPKTALRVYGERVLPALRGR
ncbi:MAG TPA: LLM class flavin-dependent oxidoreductase, partial [Gaiellaceae bacterium]|nr:LLM class flavin-dependent oxidoreductase [Gaiellaceae bacterium]